MKHLVLTSILCMALGAAALTAQAHDLGTAGDTFPIGEPNLLKLMADKLHLAKANGSLDKLNREFAERAKEHIENPHGVDGVVDTTKPRTWLFDPTIIVPQDYHDQYGRVFAHAGDRINPLERYPGYNRVMVFIDGRKPAQVRFAASQWHKIGPERVLVILTNGSPTKLDKSERMPFYFDQGGYITSHFEITHVPATVVRENNALRISEVYP